MRVINILKTTNIIKHSPNETLSQGLSKLNSSHDAAFIFDQNESFVGLVNPYYSIIKSSNPGNAKIEHCVFHPPKIRDNFAVSQVARLMIDSKVHYLPVFDDSNKFTGIVSARNLLSHVRTSNIFDQKIGDYIRTNKTKPLVTVYEDDLLSQAISLFKKHKVSKLVVVNKQLKLRGILAYYDIIQYLMTPKSRAHRGDRVGNRYSLGNQQVKNFAKSLVLTLDTSHTLRDALDLILDRSIGSVVIADSSKHPTGIITTQEFLKLLSRTHEASNIQVISRNLSNESRQIVRGFFHVLSAQIRKIPNLSRARLMIKEEKQGGVFEAVLSLIPKKGEPKIISSTGRNLKKVLDKIKRS